MADTTTFQLEIDQGLMTVTFLPRLNQIPWADIEQVGSQVVQRIHTLASPRVLVDLTPLDYMGSAQVALIVRLFKTVKEKGGTMVVASSHPVVQEVLSLAGLNKIWTIVSSREAGRQMLGGSGISLSSDGGGGGSLAIGGLVGAVLGALALVLAFSGTAIMPPVTAAWIALLAAGAAFGLGLGATLNGHGNGRSMGVGVVVVGVAVLLGSVFAIASPKQPQSEQKTLKTETEPADTDEIVEEEAEPAPKPAKSKKKTTQPTETAADEAAPAETPSEESPAAPVKEAE